LGASGETLTRLLGGRVEKYGSLMLTNISREQSYPLACYECLCKHILVVTKNELRHDFETEDLSLIDPKDAINLAEKFGLHMEKDVISPMIDVYRGVIEMINGERGIEV
jgi:hypothetical protein